MRQKSGTGKAPAEQVIKDIRRATRKQYSAEEKIRIVLEGLRGEESIAALCRREGAPMIDCQQNTGHLAFMGAAEIPRQQFVAHVAEQIAQPAMRWEFAASDWADIIPLSEMTSPHTDE